MSLLEFIQRIFAFFLLVAAVAYATNIFLFPLTWVFWKIARYPFETQFNNNKIWVW